VCRIESVLWPTTGLGSSKDCACVCARAQVSVRERKIITCECVRVCIGAFDLGVYLVVLAMSGFGGR